MLELNETNDTRLNKRKDASDVLISYALLMPVLLGIVKATDSGTIRKYQDRIVELFSSDDPGAKFAGQKILSRVIKTFGRADQPENAATALFGKTKELLQRGSGKQKDSSSTLSRKISHGADIILEAEKPSAEYGAFITDLRDSAKKELGYLDAAITQSFDALTGQLEINKYGIGKKTKALMNRARNLLEVEGERLANDPSSSKVHLRALAFAHKTSPLPGQDILTSLSGHVQNIDDIESPKVLRRYIRYIQNATRDIKINRLRSKTTPIKTAGLYLRLQTETKVLQKGGGDPIDQIVRELDDYSLRGIYGDTAPKLNTKRIANAIAGHKRFLTGAGLEDTWESAFSNEVQARNINRALQYIRQKVTTLGKRGGVWKDATVDLVVDNSTSFNIPTKLMKIVVKTRGGQGTPLEIPLPTTQFGYTFLKPNVLPMISQLIPTGPKQSSNISMASYALLKLPDFFDKMANDYQTSLSGSEAIKLWDRTLDTIFRTSSPATGTPGDVIKQTMLYDKRLELLNGLADKSEYQRAFKAQSTIEAWRTSTNLGGVHIFSFDTEYMRPGAFTRDEGVKLSRARDTRIWQIGFDILDPNKSKAIHNAGGILYIKPGNWDQIRPDVKKFLLSHMEGDFKANETRVEKMLVETIDGLDSKQSLRDALKRIEDAIKLKHGPIAILGQNQVEADTKILANQIMEEFGEEEGRAWLKRLSPLFNRDLTTVGHKQIDVMHWYRGYTLGQGMGSSNDAIFKALYKGVGMDQFGELLERSILKGDKFEVRESVIKKRIADIIKPDDHSFKGSKAYYDRVIEGTWKAYKTFINAGFTGKISFTAHVEARYDQVITALNFFELVSRELNPTQSDINQRVFLEEMSDKYRRIELGYSNPWDEPLTNFERPEYAYQVREPLYDLYGEELFDQNTGMLKTDPHTRIDVFSVPHRQASLGRGAQLFMERMLPGGFLNNMLRTKFQTFNALLLSVNPVKIMNSWTKELNKSGDKPGRPSTMSIESAYNTEQAHSLHHAFKQYANLSSYVRRVGEKMSDNIRIPTLLLPDHLSIVNDGKSYMRRTIAKHISMHGYGSGPETQIIKIALPIKEILGGDITKITGAEDMKKLFDKLAPESPLARLFQDRLEHSTPEFKESLNTTVGKLELTKKDGPILKLNRGQRLFGNKVSGTVISALEDNFTYINDDLAYTGRVEGKLINAAFDPNDGLITLQINRPSGVYAGTKMITGLTGATKDTLHSLISPYATGLNRIGRYTGYKFGKSRNELGSFVEVQINRVLDSIHHKYKSVKVQKRKLKEALKPLFGGHIKSSALEPVIYPAVKLKTMRSWTAAGDVIEVATVHLTDVGQRMLGEHADKSMFNALAGMLEEAGIDYDYVRKRFKEQAAETLKNKGEINAAWDAVKLDGIRMFEKRIASIQAELSLAPSDSQRILLGKELAALKSQLFTLTDQAHKGPVLYDPSYMVPARGMAPIITFDSYIANLPVRFAETTPYEYSRGMLRPESRYGIPVGPQTTSSYNQLVLENTIRMLDSPSAGAGASASTEAWIARLRQDLGGERVSMETNGISLLKENMKATNLSLYRLLYGTSGKALRPISEDMVTTLSDSGLQKLVDALSTAKDKNMVEFMKEQYQIVLDASDPDKWSREIEEQLKDRPDLSNKAPEIEALGRSKKVQTIESNMLKFVDSDGTTKYMDIFRHDIGTLAAFKVPIKDLSNLKRHGVVYKYLQQLVTDAQNNKLQKESADSIFGKLTFNIEEAVLDRLEKTHPEESRQLREILVAKANATGGLETKLDFIPFQKLVGAMGLQDVRHSIGGEIKDQKIIGGISREMLDIVKETHKLNTLSAGLENYLEEQLPIKGADNAELKKEAQSMLDQYKLQKWVLQKKINENAFQGIFAPSYGLLTHKAFTSYAPVSYGKLLGSFGLLPTLSDLYSSMQKSVDGKPNEFTLLWDQYGEHGGYTKESQFKKAFGFKGAPAFSVDIRRSFANLIGNPRNVSKNPLFSKAGDILFRGMGVNQTVISLSTAKQFIQSEIADRGGKITPHLIKWLKGEELHVMGINRNPVTTHTSYGIAAVSVAPDELWSLMGFPVDKDRGIVNAAIFIDPLTQSIVNADFDGDLGFLTSLGDDAGKYASMVNKNTAYTVRVAVEANMKAGSGIKNGIKIGDVTVENVEQQLKKITNLNKAIDAGKKDPVIYNLNYTVPDPKNQKNIAGMSIADLLPRTLYSSAAETEYEMIRSMKADEYLTQQLSVGRIGAMHKFFTAQALGYENSAYAQMADLNLKKDGPELLNQVIKNRNLTRFVGNAAYIPKIAKGLYESVPGDPSVHPIISRFETWSGQIQEEVSIRKAREELEGVRGKVSGYLKAFGTFAYDRQASETDVRNALDKLIWDKKNPKMSWLYYYYNPFQYEGRQLSELSTDEFETLKSKATNWFEVMYGLNQIGHELGGKVGSDFRSRYLRSPAQGEKAQMMALMGEDYAISSAFTQSITPWARNMGFLSTDYSSLLISQFMQGGEMFNRKSAIEMLGEKVRNMLSENSYKILGRSSKLAGLVALGAMALDPNANSLLIGDTPGRGGEEYDIPTLSNLAKVYRKAIPKMAEPSAPFMDKMRNLFDMPTEIMPQLKQNKDKLPKRPPIRYTGRRKPNYNRLNIQQAIKSANVINLS